MDTFYILCMTLCFIFGVVIGVIIKSLSTTVGTLKIDISDPDKDVYRLEIDNLDIIPKKKKIVLKVKKECDLSQE